jgi:hypothetical protein
MQQHSEKMQIVGYINTNQQNAFNSIPTGRYKRGNYEGINKYRIQKKTLPNEIRKAR